MKKKIKTTKKFIEIYNDKELKKINGGFSFSEFFGPSIAAKNPPSNKDKK